VGGSDVWVDWNPSRGGRFTVFAELLEKPMDGLLGNARDELVVTVDSSGRLRGHAEKVGSRRANGEVELVGKQHFPGLLDLRRATLTVEEVLSEESASGELLRGRRGASILPLTLRARPGSRRNRALFESEDSEPELEIEVELDPRKTILKVRLEAEDGQIARPAECATGKTAELGTRLTLEDGLNPPVVLGWLQPWRCGPGQLRAR